MAANTWLGFSGELHSGFASNPSSSKTFRLEEWLSVDETPQKGSKDLTERGIPDVGGREILGRGAARLGRYAIGKSTHNSHYQRLGPQTLTKS